MKVELWAPTWISDRLVDQSRPLLDSSMLSSLRPGDEVLYSDYVGRAPFCEPLRVKAVVESRVFDLSRETLQIVLKSLEPVSPSAREEAREAAKKEAAKKK